MKRKLNKKAVAYGLLILANSIFTSSMIFKITIFGWITNKQYQLSWTGLIALVLSISIIFNGFDYFKEKKI